MSKRKVTFEDGNGEIELEEEVPSKKVRQGLISLLIVSEPHLITNY
jgi:hypothetical protein